MYLIVLNSQFIRILAIQDSSPQFEQGKSLSSTYMKGYINNQLFSSFIKNTAIYEPRRWDVGDLINISFD
ncbi:hypothetical protein [Caldifermentibacillus hisashii]|uniref:hypothetical protein n=1 Tax=Caldifermentibacillus hisashii TaxID=996558 RepID=UPI0034D61DF3